MSEIGRWGTQLVFSVNSDKQLPFRDMSRKVKARWKTHNVYGRNPWAEYMGSDQTEVKMEVTFSAHHGQKPLKSISILEESCARGQLEYLFIGGKKVGKYKHYIDSINTDWDEVWNKGELVRATVEITFKEAR